MKYMYVIVLLFALVLVGCKSKEKEAKEKKKHEKEVKAPEGMVYVTGGSFKMGSNVSEDEKPIHTVTLSEFFIGKFEVSQKEWKALMGDNPSQFIGDSLPVENVRWYGAVEFCNKKSEKEGLKPVYTIDKNTKNPNNFEEADSLKWTVTADWEADGYRLPTEAEWEYAARGGSKSKGFEYSGSNSVQDVAWYGYDAAEERTHPSGMKKPNELGIYDMSGNVEEWVWGWYNKEPYDTVSVENPYGAESGFAGIRRGGSWLSDPENVRVAERGWEEPGFPIIFTGGFRLVRNVPQQ